MEWYHYSMLAAALGTGWMAHKTPRAWLWIGLLAASFIISVSYLNMDHPVWLPHPGIAMMVDAIVYLAIREVAEERWEKQGLGGLIMVSVTLNLVQTSAIVTGFPPQLPQWAYAIALEIINYLSLALIFGRGLIQRIEGKNGLPSLPFPRWAGRPVARLGTFAKAKSVHKRPLGTWK